MEELAAGLRAGRGALPGKEPAGVADPSAGEQYLGDRRAQGFGGAPTPRLDGWFRELRKRRWEDQACRLGGICRVPFGAAGFRGDIRFPAIGRAVADLI